MKFIRNPETGSYKSEDGNWLISNLGGRSFNPRLGRTARVWQVRLLPLGNLVNVFTLDDAKYYINQTMSNRADSELTFNK